MCPPSFGEGASKLAQPLHIKMVQPRAAQDVKCMFQHTEAQQLVQKLFSAIDGSRTISDLEMIPGTLDLVDEIKRRMPGLKYPKLMRGILTESDVRQLRRRGVITDERLLSSTLAQGYTAKGRALTSLEKLLYAILWKNGDIGKERHLLNGVCDLEQEDRNGAVFHAFGRYVAGRQAHILDQHTLRCFGVAEAKCCDAIAKARRLEAISNKNDLHKKWIECYEREQNRWGRLCKKDERPDFLYAIDRLLFAVGKLIKIK